MPRDSESAEHEHMRDRGTSRSGPERHGTQAWDAGMLIGILAAAGTAVGVAIGGGTGIALGTAVGAAAGVVIGAALRSWRRP